MNDTLYFPLSNFTLNRGVHFDWGDKYTKFFLSANKLCKNNLFFFFCLLQGTATCLFKRGAKVLIIYHRATFFT